MASSTTNHQYQSRIFNYEIDEHQRDITNLNTHSSYHNPSHRQQQPYRYDARADGQYPTHSDHSLHPPFSSLPSVRPSPHGRLQPLMTNREFSPTLDERRPVTEEERWRAEVDQHRLQHLQQQRQHHQRHQPSRSPYSYDHAHLHFESPSAPSKSALAFACPPDGLTPSELIEWEIASLEGMIARRRFAEAERLRLGHPAAILTSSADDPLRQNVSLATPLVTLITMPPVETAYRINAKKRSDTRSDASSSPQQNHLAPPETTSLLPSNPSPVPSPRPAPSQDSPAQSPSHPSSHPISPSIPSGRYPPGTRITVTTVPPPASPPQAAPAQSPPTPSNTQPKTSEPDIVAPPAKPEPKAALPTPSNVESTAVPPAPTSAHTSFDPPAPATATALSPAPATGVSQPVDITTSPVSESPPPLPPAIPSTSRTVRFPPPCNVPTPSAHPPTLKHAASILFVDDPLADHGRPTAKLRANTQTAATGIDPPKGSNAPTSHQPNKANNTAVCAIM